MHHRYLGRGPKTASTFHNGNVLVTLMHEVLTHAEKSLTENGQIDAVKTIRHLFQETMAADFREAVERLTGRKVVAFISGNHIDPDPAKAGALKSWAKAYWEGVHPHNLGGGYVNFMSDDEGEERVKASYGANFERLVAVKRKYDPENLFRVNQNINPSA